MSGASVGIMLTPLLILFLIQQYGWRWAMRFHALIALNIAVISWIMRVPIPDETAKKANQTFGRKIINNIKSLFLMFTDFYFVVALISHLLFFQMMILTVVHTPSRIKSIGYSVEWGTYLISIMAAANLASR